MNSAEKDTNQLKARNIAAQIGSVNSLSDPDAWICASLIANNYAAAVKDLLPRIKSWICEHHCIAADDAEELAIETIRRVGNKVTIFAGHSLFFSWVIGFAKFVVLEHFGDNPDREALSFDSLVGERAIDSYAADKWSTETDPEMVALMKLEICDAKRTLTLLEASVHRLCFDEGHTYQEAASKIGGEATANSVAKALQRATEKIGRHMKEQGCYP